MTLDEILTLAVNDMAEHGYDSPERVAYWQAQLREAMQGMMLSGEAVEQMLRDKLATVYRRMVEDEGVLRRHPEVSKFTLAQIKPTLRRELDRRILASADLIRLNRAQSKEQTLRRFSGWATSIPAGGSNNVDRRGEKKRLRKAIAQLPFEQRRVLIDQGHKLAASISAVVAEGSGAIAVVWHSHWRQPGYNYRPDHKERDGHVYLLRSSWAREAGLVKPGEAGCYEDITAFAEEPFCRCYGQWLSTLGALPDGMLTAKGRETLKRGKARSALS